MLPTRDLQIQGHIKTESDGMERGILCKCKIKRKLEQHTPSGNRLKIKTSTRDKEGHYLVMKRSIQEEDTTINTYASNIGVPQYGVNIGLAKKFLQVSCSSGAEA